MSPESVGAALEEAARVEGLGVGFWSAPGSIDLRSYAELADGARRFAAGLQELGVQPGERVALVLPTCPEFYIAWFGASLAGAVPTALYPPARLGRVTEWRERTARMLLAADCVLVVTERRLQGFLGAPVASCDPAHGCRTTAGVIHAGRGARFRHTPPHRLAAVQFSSGSTGDPKPVALTQSNMLSNARSILARLPGKPSEHRGVSWLPLYHDMGLVGCLLAAVVAKAQMTLIPPERFVARPLSWLEAISETRATVSVAPNFAFGLTADRVSDEDLQGLDLSDWTVALCGAEPVHPRTLDRFADRLAGTGFRREALTPVYGLAEATLAVTFSELGSAPRWQSFDPERLASSGRAVPAEAGRRLASLGRPLDCAIVVRNSAGQDLAADRVGTVHVRGPSVMDGYLGREEATRQVLDADGWLDTGDTGFLHRGELYLCGRSKDLIIVRGRNHDPALVEQAIEGIPGVRAGCSAAFACPDEETDSERVVVVCEVRDLTSSQVTELTTEAVRRIHSQTGLTTSDFVAVAPGTLPRTSSGKIRRAETRRHYLEQNLTPPEEVSLRLVIRENARGLLHHGARRLRRSARRP